jgi:hypothetical protein
MIIRGVYEPAFKLRCSWEGPMGKCGSRQPDSGNPTVRDETGGLRKRYAWSDGHLPRSRKRRILWKPVDLHMSAPQLYPNGSGRQGRNPADVSSAVLVARVEYVVMPQLTEGNPVFIAWCKRPGCSVEILFGHPPRCLKNIGRLLEATKFTK